MFNGQEEIKKKHIRHFSKQLMYHNNLEVGLLPNPDLSIIILSFSKNICNFALFKILFSVFRMAKLNITRMAKMLYIF